MCNYFPACASSFSARCAVHDKQRQLREQMSSTAPQQHAAAPSAVDKSGYQGFGSFHSEDVEVLVRQDSATYQPPPLPFPDPLVTAAGHAAAATAGPADTSSKAATNNVPASSSSSSGSETSACFGDAAKLQFLIDFSSWTFINHGAFGGVAELVYCCAELWRRHCELQPLRFIDRCAAAGNW
jgi:hypothetical protein